MATPKFTNPFVSVETEEVKVGGQAVPKVGVSIKDDNGEKHCVGILGKDYSLIKNQVAHDVAHDVMTRSPYDWQELKSTWNGKQYLAHYITKNPLVADHGIPLHAGILVRNAYDGTGKFGFELFACNQVCMNQYINRNRFGYFAIRHDAKLNFNIEDALQKVSDGSQKLLEVAPVIHAMRDKKLTSRVITTAKANTSIPQSKWGDVIDRLGQEEDNQFGLFQAMTYCTTHLLTGFTAIGIGDGVSEYMLNQAEG